MLTCASLRALTTTPHILRQRQRHQRTVKPTPPPNATPHTNPSHQYHAATPKPSALPFHPSLFLDAACATCCIVLLASSAARRLALSSRPTSPTHPAHLPTPTPSTSNPPTTLLPDTPPAHHDSNACRHSSAGVTTPETQQTQQQRQQQQRLATSAPEPPTAPSPPTPHSFPADLMAACHLAMAVGNMLFKLRGTSPTAAATGPTSLEAVARLARLEALTDKQLTEFAAAIRQIDKLQVRTRLTSGDIRKPIAQLQSSAAAQSSLLTRLAAEQEALRNQLRDTQQLLAALQGLTAKQFQVTVDAIKQLRARQQTAT